MAMHINSTSIPAANCVASRWPLAARLWHRSHRYRHAPVVGHATPERPSSDTGPKVLALPASPPSAPEKAPVQRTGGGGSGGDGDKEPPSGPSLSALRLAALLTEFGGIPGTAAVLAGHFTHVDAFGGLFGSGTTAEAALAGLQIFLPLLVLDGFLMLPDYSLSDVQGMRSAASLFLGDAVVVKQEADAASSSSDSSKSNGSNGQLGPLQGVMLRARLALEVVQTHMYKANPGAGMSPATEGLVILVSSLAGEMLYRAVVLTLLSYWLRDRLFEAGMDDTVVLSLFGSSTEVATSALAQYASVAAIGVAGMAAYIARAWQEVQAIRNIKIMTKDGKEAGEDAAAIKRQLISSVGTQHAVVYGVEGVREVAEALMAGLAFVTTGNLIAPLAGKIASQAWMSWLQRFAAERAFQRRRAMLNKWRERAAKVKAAMQAVVAARGTAADDSTAEAGAASSGSSSSGGEAVAGDAPAAVVVSDEAGERTLQDWGQGMALPDAPSDSGDGEAGSQQQLQGEVHIAGSSNSSSNGASSQQAMASSSAALSGDQAQHSQASTAEQQQMPAFSLPSFFAPAAASSATASPAAAASPALPQTAALLEDMLRSKEGRSYVQRFLATSGAKPQASGVTGDAASDYVDELLSDPETKRRLVAELEAQLLAMAEKQKEQESRAKARQALMQQGWPPRE